MSIAYGVGSPVFLEKCDPVLLFWFVLPVFALKSLPVGRLPGVAALNLLPLVHRSDGGVAVRVNRLNDEGGCYALDAVVRDDQP